MASPNQKFRPIRACIFDMDGLLLNTEDIYTLCADNNQLPLSREQFEKEGNGQDLIHFPECEVLPGAQKLLLNLKNAHNINEMPIKIALASSRKKYQYDLKATKSKNKAVLNLILEEFRILAGDPRVKHGRGKPAPEIYLVALETINSRLPTEIPKIVPEECLVFEDSVPGVEAGRRAGMRVIWVPHPGIYTEWGAKEKDVLAGRSGLMDIGNKEQIGEADGGFGEYLPALEDFSYKKYGIVLPA